MADATINFDLLARDRASDKFEKIGKSADKMGSRLSKVGKVAKVGMLALAGATAGAVGALGLMVKSAIEDEQSQTRLAKTLKNTTGATKEQISSVEDWITAQGKALGVADDDLRPALDKLAVATGSITKAQSLASLAMNVSAGTGKSLQAVSLALAKGYAGNVGGLGRLGIATKDAAGKTKTFAQIQSELAQKFKGQAAVAADTFAGRMRRFKLAISEAGESIGYTLLPFLSRLAGLVVNKVIPAVETGAKKVGKFFTDIRKSAPVQSSFDAIKKAASGIGDGFGKAARAIGKIKSAVDGIDLSHLDGSKIGTALADAIVSGLQRLGQLAGKIGQVLGDLFAKVDWVGLGIAIGKQAPALILGLAAGLLNFDMGSVFRGIMAHWQEVLLAVIFVVLAPAKFIGPIGRVLEKIPFVGKFLAVALRWVNSLGGKLKSFGGDLLSSFWRGFTSRPIPGASFVVKVIRAVAGLPGALMGFWRDLGLKIGVWSLDAFEAAGRGARGGIGKLVRFAGTIAGRVLRAVGNLASLLFSAGQDIIRGLLNGVSSMAGALTSKMTGIAKGALNAAKGALGIHSPSKKFHEVGQNVMQGLLNGLKSKWMPVKDYLAKVTDQVKAAGENLQGLLAQRNDMASGFRGFSTSIFGRDTGTDADGNTNPESVAGILAFAAKQQQEAASLARNVQRLVGMGLSKDLLAQLRDQGSSGIAQINTLAASATRGDIARLNASNKATAGYDTQAGMSVANAILGGDIAQARREEAQAKAIAKAVENALHGSLKDLKIEGVVKGNDLYIMIQREQKRRGKTPTV